MLTREAILGAQDVTVEKVLAPEWATPGEEGQAFFYVRVMSGAARDQFDNLMWNRPEDTIDTYMRTRLLCLTICDAQGHLLFSLADIEALSQKSWKPLDRAWDVATRLNRVDKEAVEDAKKNS